MTKLKKSIFRATVGTLDGSFGPDRGKPLVVGLEPGDVITIRPGRSRRTETVSLTDVYRFAIARRAEMERRERKPRTRLVNRNLLK